MFYKPAVHRPALLVLYVPRARFARVVRLDFARCLFSGSSSILPRVHRQAHPPACRLSFPGLQRFLYFLILSLPSFFLFFFFYSFSRMIDVCSFCPCLCDSHCRSTQCPRDNAFLHSGSRIPSLFRRFLKYRRLRSFLEKSGSATLKRPFR